MLSRSRIRSRNWTAAACLLATAVVLTGCTDDGSTGPDTDEPQQTMSPGETTAGTSPSGGPPEPFPSTSATASVRWGSYGNRSDACTAVAANVVAIAVLPMSLNISGDPQEIGNAEDEIEKMRHSAPEELKADFARVQLMIDSFGEQVAAGKRAAGEEARLEGTTDDGGTDSGVDSREDNNDGSNGGNGGADERDTVQSPPTDATGGSEAPEFNSDDLQDALDPVKQWLTENCERSPRG